MTSLNKDFNYVASEQGIEVLSELWLFAGFEGVGHSTGGHNCYGWKHSHLLNGHYVRAAIANYCHRRCYYENEPFREGGYEIGGRPLKWKPEDAQDTAEGWVTYFTSKGFVKICGPDATHFHIGPLVEIYDADAYQVKVYGQMVSAKIVAGEVIKHLMATMAGQLRKPNGGYHNYGDRGVANVLKAVSQAMNRGLISPADQVTFYDWAKNWFIPTFTQAPGHGYNYKDANPPKGSGIAPKYTFQLYNGLYWTLPGAFDLLALAIKLNLVELIPGLTKIVERKCHWMKNILEHVGHFDVESLEIDQSIMQNPEAPLDLKPYIKSVLGGGWSKWGFRAASIAAFVLKDEKLKSECAKIRATHDSKIKEEKAKLDAAPDHDPPFLAGMVIPWFVDYKLDYV